MSCYFSDYSERICFHLTKIALELILFSLNLADAKIKRPKVQQIIINEKTVAML